jgi:hypothetical protein
MAAWSSGMILIYIYICMHTYIHTSVAVLAPMFTFRPPPLDSDAAIFQNPQWAEPFAKFLRHAARPVRVISPCAGVNGPERAAREMQMPWQSLGDFDCNPPLRPALLLLADNPDVVHVGPRSGDVLTVPLGDLDLSADGLVSGPLPYPPYPPIPLSPISPYPPIPLTPYHIPLSRLRPTVSPVQQHREAAHRDGCSGKRLRHGGHVDPALGPPWLLDLVGAGECVGHPQATQRRDSEFRRLVLGRDVACAAHWLAHRCCGAQQLLVPVATEQAPSLLHRHLQRVAADTTAKALAVHTAALPTPCRHHPLPGPPPVT